MLPVYCSVAREGGRLRLRIEREPENTSAAGGAFCAPTNGAFCKTAKCDLRHTLSVRFRLHLVAGAPSTLRRFRVRGCRNSGETSMPSRTRSFLSTAFTLGLAAIVAAPSQSAEPQQTSGTNTCKTAVPFTGTVKWFNNARVLDLLLKTTVGGRVCTPHSYRTRGVPGTC
jgi:hypothetical protein